uniref:Uncharacterized protein n=2 Tax=Thermorudis TaxID=1649508 RepID=A0A7C2WDC6_9BACT
MELSPDRMLSIVLLVSFGGLVLSRRASRSLSGQRRVLMIARSRGRLISIWTLICTGILGLTTGLWALLSLVLPEPAVPAAVFAIEAVLLDFASQRVRFRAMP